MTFDYKIHDALRGLRVDHVWSGYDGGPDDHAYLAQWFLSEMARMPSLGFDRNTPIRAYDLETPTLAGAMLIAGALHLWTHGGDGRGQFRDEVAPEMWRRHVGEIFTHRTGGDCAECSITYANILHGLGWPVRILRAMNGLVDRVGEQEDEPRGAYYDAHVSVEVWCADIQGWVWLDTLFQSVAVVDHEAASYVAARDAKYPVFLNFGPDRRWGGDGYTPPHHMKAMTVISRRVLYAMSRPARPSEARANNAPIFDLRETYNTTRPHNAAAAVIADAACTEWRLIDATDKPHEDPRIGAGVGEICATATRDGEGWTTTVWDRLMLKAATGDRDARDAMRGRLAVPS